MSGPDSSHPGSGAGDPPRRLPQTDTEIQEVMLQRAEGPLPRSLPVRLSVKPAALYYCHFTSVLTPNRSWHIITFGVFSSGARMRASELCEGLGILLLILVLLIWHREKLELVHLVKLSTSNLSQLPR